MTWLFLTWLAVLPPGTTGDHADDDTAMLQRRLRAAATGPEIMLDARVYRLRATLDVPGGTRLRSQPGTVLRFDLPDGLYGLALAPGARDVLLENLVLVGGGVRMTDGERFENITVRRCVFTRMPGTHAIYITIPSRGVVIESCRFHDFDQLAINVYHVDRFELRGNVFERVEQGAHLLNPENATRVVGNHGRKLHRMGIEIQQLDETAPITRDLLVEGNVFHDWVRPYTDSFGLSIMPCRAHDVRIVGNHLLATHEGPRGPVNENGNLFGFGIEAGFLSGVVENNVVAGPFWYGIVVSEKDTPVVRNRVFGIERGHEITGEVGGSPRMLGNAIVPTLQGLPPVPPPPRDVPAAFVELTTTRPSR